MLTAEGCAARRRRFWERLPREIEAALVADPRHVLYLSNFYATPVGFSHPEQSILLLERNGPTTLVLDNFLARASRQPLHVDRVIEAEWYDHRHSVADRRALRIRALVDALSGRAFKGAAVERRALPHAAAQVVEATFGRLSAQHAEVVDTTLLELRRAKDADELDILRACMQATEAGHARARQFVRPGVSELDVYREVQAAATSAAGQPVIVYGDFRAVNAQNPKRGGLPTPSVLREGDLFLLDYSVVIHGYRSDFTNTIAVGRPTSQQTMLYDLCMAALRAGEERLKPGTPAREVWRAVHEAFASAGYAAFFPHHAGHGLGLAHPEPPILVPESTDTLVAGDVVTLEPGLYVPGIGGMRFEHNYAITADGPDRLSNHALAL